MLSPLSHSGRITQKSRSSVYWSHYVRWNLILHVRRSSSNASLGRHILILLMAGLWIMFDVSTSTRASHAPIWFYACYSKTSLRVCSSNSPPQSSWCHSHLAPEDACSMPAPEPWTSAFCCIQLFYNMSHPCMTLDVTGAPPMSAHHKILEN